MSRALQIVGVLNVTPDSFHDGGRFTDVASALTCVKQMLEEGADIIEVGGESTGPRSPDISAEDEERRVLPVIEAITQSFPDARISVDTYKSSVAAKAIARGVTMINDVTAGRGDARMFAVLKESPAKLVLMYSKDATPRTTIGDVQYMDV